MNPDKKDLYTITWNQSYPMRPLQEAMDEIVETLLERSNFKEANQVIDFIKSKK